MPSALELSDLQLAVMRVVWDKGEASASDVQRALHRSRGLAITTVSTLLTRLEKRGLLSHRADGRTFVYRAKISERDVRRSMLSSLVDGLFRGDASAVVSQLLAAGDVTEGDIDRIQELVEDAKRSAPPERATKEVKRER
jgi:predicted transcriptional regulator